MEYVVDDKISAIDFISYIKNESIPFNIKNNLVYTPTDTFEISDNFKSVISELEFIKQFEDSFIYGKDRNYGIVSIEVNDSNIELFMQDGSVKVVPFRPWVLSNRKIDNRFKSLDGNLNYRYIRYFDCPKEANRQAFLWEKQGYDIYRVYNHKESAMISTGITLFKGLKVEEVSVLSFDIEGAGLEHSKDSNVFLITNTFVKNSKTVKKHFRLDHYDNCGEMIEDWCSWVRNINPDIINGHNIYGYDLPYLQHCASMFGKKLDLGRDGSPIRFETKSSQYRVDGSQSWTYFKAYIYGRHIIDGMFLAVKYDIGRKYPTWGLKSIIEAEGLVKEGRQFYDASKIAENWNNLEEREKIVAYGIDDSDDSYNLYKLMISSLFYTCQSIPKSFQDMINGATGSWINSFLVRSYLQEGHSIPKPDEAQRVAGGMSNGWAGVYSNVSKWDAASYYPSTILTFDIYNRQKDPKAYFLRMVDHFTKGRFADKKKHKETGLKYFDDLQAAKKIFINSAYGLLGTNGLNFNSFEDAALITKCCRKGLQKAIVWATGQDIKYWWQDYEEPQDFEDYSFIDAKSKLSFNDMPRHDWVLVNIDTDSLSFAKKDGSEFTPDEITSIHDEVNKIMYSPWEDDGLFDKVVILKAKNYCLLPKGSTKIKKKGSSIIDSKKEPALLEMIDKIIDSLIYNRNNLIEIYHSYVNEVLNIKDITRWSVKRTITSKVLNGTRANETKILDAVDTDNVREGEKVYLYTADGGMIQKREKGELCFYKNGLPKMVKNTILKQSQDWIVDHDVEHYLGRIYKTFSIFSSVLNLEDFPDLTKAKNKLLIENYR